MWLSPLYFLMYRSYPDEDGHKVCHLQSLNTMPILKYITPYTKNVQGKGVLQKKYWHIIQRIHYFLHTPTFCLKVLYNIWNDAYSNHVLPSRDICSTLIVHSCIWILIWYIVDTTPNSINHVKEKLQTLVAFYHKPKMKKT